ncbi:hypothetical protein Tco_0951103 [Tanacetum coccineum]|uniref:Uncharacterized protein n=1 Tax=Tanacetum coccineum TaxID=301880 RepID=A0ABQ5DVX4_9ASTR
MLWLYMLDVITGCTLRRLKEDVRDVIGYNIDVKRTSDMILLYVSASTDESIWENSRLEDVLLYVDSVELRGSHISSSFWTLEAKDKRLLEDSTRDGKTSPRRERMEEEEGETTPLDMGQLQYSRALK